MLEDIHASNQVIQPACPVLLHKRRQRIDESAVSSSSGSPAATTGGGGGGGGVDPGRSSEAVSYPALRIEVERRYEPDTKINYTTVTGTGVGTGTSTADEGRAAAELDATNLMFFDVATVWIAPLNLNIDEDAFVRGYNYAQALLTSTSRSEVGAQNRLREEVLAIQHKGTRSWGTMEPQEVAAGYAHMLADGLVQYRKFRNTVAPRAMLFFAELELCPLDIFIRFYASPNVDINGDVLSTVSAVAQMDGLRLCLNPFHTQKALGSPAFVSEAIGKHYRNQIFRLAPKILGKLDLVEGSVSLVTNFGVGVSDLFYEPLEGYRNNNLLKGISRGGKSLATRTIGGTSAFASNTVGGAPSCAMHTSYFYPDSIFAAQ